MSRNNVPLFSRTNKVHSEDQPTLFEEDKRSSKYWLNQELKNAVPDFETKVVEKYVDRKLVMASTAFS